MIVSFSYTFILAFDFLPFLRGHSFFFFPRHNGQWPSTLKDFLSQILSITFFSYLNSSERASISLFNVECQTTGTIFIASLVWRDPWLGIELWTSRTRSQHSTTRLSRRRYVLQWSFAIKTTYEIDRYWAW